MNIEKLARSYTSLFRAIERFPKAPWKEALSHTELHSKAWAISELIKAKKNLGLVYIMGGWLGTFGPLLFSEPRFKITAVRSFDIDPTCEPIADQLNIEHLITEWHYKAVTKDIYKIDYDNHKYEIVIPGGYEDESKNFVTNRPKLLIESPDTIINTACDYTNDFETWWDMIPRGKLVLLQSNSLKEDKVRKNIVNTLQKFADQAPMTKIMFSGERDYAKSRHFMLIGNK